MLEYIKRCWKQVATTVGVLAIITSILTFDARYAKTDDIKNVETKVAATIDQLQKNLQLQQDITRLNNVTDQMIKTRGLVKQYPKDKDFKEDYEILKSQRTKIQEKIDKGVQ